MRKFLVLGCLAAALMLRPAVAAADSLSYAGLGSGAWVNLKLGSVTETGWAGEIKWTLNVNGVSSAITTYCGDLFDDAKWTQYGNLTTTAALDANPAMSYGAVASAGSMAAYLVNTNAASAHSSNTQAAGLQIAIWQAMFGTSAFSVLDSTPNRDLIMGAAAGYTLPSGQFWASAAYFDVVNGAGIGSLANGQDQIVVGTPEPATIFLLLFAMGVMFVYQVRFRQQRGTTI